MRVSVIKISRRENEADEIIARAISVDKT
jgi:hypothetical protein